MYLPDNEMLRGPFMVNDLHTNGNPAAEQAFADVHARVDAARLSQRLYTLREGIGRMATQNIALQSSSVTDSLTQILNRRGFDEALGEAYAGGNSFGVLLIDLDGIKAINDQQGHAAGDEMIKKAADCIQHSVREPKEDRPGDVAADSSRLGGDEFAVLLRNIESEEDLLAVAARVQKTLADHSVSASVGASLFDAQAPRDLQTIMQEADLRLYADKAQRKFDKSTRAQRFVARLCDKLLRRTGVELRDVPTLAKPFPGNTR